MKLFIKSLILSIILLGCSSEDSSDLPNSDNAVTGQGGSLSRFAILGDYMYVADQANLNVFQISDPKNPIEANSTAIGFTSNIETLFSYGDYLFIGSQNGFFIYDVYKNPESPKKLAEVQHFRACDPVVANETHAYVTLHTSDFNCGNNINELQVYDIANKEKPIQLPSRSMKSPKGLALLNDYLFVCDDEVKVFDITNPSKLSIVSSISQEAFDIIIRENLIILIGKNGLYQYSLDTNDVTKTELVSTIKI